VVPPPLLFAFAPARPWSIGESERATHVGVRMPCACLGMQAGRVAAARPAAVAGISGCPRSAACVLRTLRLPAYVRRQPHSVRQPSRAARPRTASPDSCPCNCSWRKLQHCTAWRLLGRTQQSARRRTCSSMMQASARTCTSMPYSCDHAVLLLSPPLDADWTPDLAQGRARGQRSSHLAVPCRRGRDCSWHPDRRG
jgi:hypothetical protein